MEKKLEGIATFDLSINHPTFDLCFDILYGDIIFNHDLILYTFPIVLFPKMFVSVYIYRFDNKREFHYDHIVVSTLKKFILLILSRGRQRIHLLIIMILPADFI